MDIKNLIELSKTNKLVFDPDKELTPDIELLYDKDVASDLDFIINKDIKRLNIIMEQQLKDESK